MILNLFQIAVKIVNLFLTKISKACSPKPVLLWIGFLYFIPGVVLAKNPGQLSIQPQALLSENAVQQIKFSSDEEFLISSHANNRIRIWEIQADLNLYAELIGHATTITSFDFDDASRQAITNDISGVSYIWNLTTVIPSFIDKNDFSPPQKNDVYLSANFLNKGSALLLLRTGYVKPLENNVGKVVLQSLGPGPFLQLAEGDGIIADSDLVENGNSFITVSRNGVVKYRTISNLFLQPPLSTNPESPVQSVRILDWDNMFLTFKTGYSILINNNLVQGTTSGDEKQFDYSFQKQIVFACMDDHRIKLIFPSGKSSLSEPQKFSLDDERGYITSIAVSKKGTLLEGEKVAVGRNNGTVEIYSVLDLINAIPTPTPLPATPTPTASNTPTPTHTPTSTDTPTLTNTPLPTNTPVPTPSPSSTHTPTHTPSPTRTPTRTFTPTSTFTRTPTFTLTPSFTQTHTSTPIPQPPRWIRSIPDIRLLKGQAAQNILDFNAFVHDADTPSDALQWSLEFHSPLSFTLDSERHLSADAIDTIGYAGNLTIRVSDGSQTIEQEVNVKVSSFITTPFSSIPPIVLIPGKTYTSDFTLNQTLLNPQEQSTDLYQWSVVQPLPQGVQQVEIHEDTSFSITAESGWKEQPVSLPFIVKRVEATPTLTATPTVPPTPTSIPPTPTPTPHGIELFTFPSIQFHNTLAGPVDWFVLPGTATPGIVMSHYFEGAVGFYDEINTRFTLSSLFRTDFGVGNVVQGDFNGDTLPDLYTLQTVLETLNVYTQNEDGTYSFSQALDLTQEQIPDVFDLRNGTRYQSLLVGHVNGDDLSDAIIRTRQAVLVALEINSQLQITSRLEFDGIVRFLKGSDFDNDGDLDFIVALATSEGHEQLLVYQNQEGTPVLVQTFRTDLGFEGNNPRDVVLTDWNGDAITDMSVLLFSGAIRRFAGNGDASFTEVDEMDVFPPGEITAFDVVDLDGNGDDEIIALLRNQEGISLVVVCCEGLSEIATFLISDSAPSREIHVLRTLDIDKDGDPDILFTRSFQDDMVIIENGIK